MLTNLSTGLTGFVLITGASMEPLYAARLEDLRPGDLFQLECACGPSEQLMLAMLRTDQGQRI